MPGLPYQTVEERIKKLKEVGILECVYHNRPEYLLVNLAPWMPRGNPVYQVNNGVR